MSSPSQSRIGMSTDAKLEDFDPLRDDYKPAVGDKVMFERAPRWASRHYVYTVTKAFHDWVSVTIDFFEDTFTYGMPLEDAQRIGIRKA